MKMKMKMKMEICIGKSFVSEMIMIIVRDKNTTLLASTAQTVPGSMRITPPPLFGDCWVPHIKHYFHSVFSVDRHSMCPWSPNPPTVETHHWPGSDKQNLLIPLFKLNEPTKSLPAESREKFCNTISQKWILQINITIKQSFHSLCGSCQLEGSTCVHSFIINKYQLSCFILWPLVQHTNRQTDNIYHWQHL